MSERKNISSGAPWEEKAAYSRAVRKGNFIAVAGTTAVLDGEIVGKGSAYLQSVHIFNLMTTALERAGSSLSDVVRTRMFVSDIQYAEQVMRAHKEFFDDIRPAATLVEVSGFVDADMLVEIEAEAIVG